MKKQNRYIALLIIVISLIMVGSCLTACQANSFSLAVTEKKMMSGTEGSTGAATYTESIAKLKHNYQVTVAEPTYTQSGNNVGKYTACSKTYTDSYKTYEDTSTDSGNNIYDPSLTPPEVAHIQLKYSYIGINCYADFETNIGYGYECVIARDKDFTQGVKNDKADSEWNNMGFAKLSFFYASGSYYYRLRTYRTEGDICYYGPWSEVGQLSCINYNNKLDKEAQYSYEIYFMDNLGTDVYTGREKAVYIKTDNPNNYAVDLKVNGESILWNIVILGKKGGYYDDVEYLDIMDYDSALHKVPGGYQGIINAETAGKLTVEVQELSSEGYVVAKTFSLNVLDYETARNAWIDNVIETQTDSTMNPKEKMDAISKYLTNGEFKYLANSNGSLVKLAAQPNSPWFLTKRWDSATSPSMLAVFAERIGGFEEIHNCYGDYPRGTYEWQVYHHQTYVVYNGEKYYYTVCPLTYTGDVGTVKMIDFNDTAQLKRVECAIEHSYKTVWSTDDEKHWHQCYSCDDKVDVSEHSYDNIFDTDCNDCGHIREPEGILGDVNNDGEANNLDAAIVLKYDAGILEEFSDTQRLHSDVDRDGEITNIDASLILKYDAGIIENF